MTYPRLRRYIRFTDDALARWIDHFAIMSTVVEDLPLPTAPIVREDPDDDRYLVVATMGRAPYVVSGDRQLLRLGVYGTMTVVPPKRFLEILPGQQTPGQEP